MTTSVPSRTTTAPLPPGPRAPVAVQTWLFGNYRQVLMPLLRRRYGDVIRLRLYPGRNVVQLADVDDIRTVFAGPAKVFHAGEGNMVLKPVMGGHSVLITDEDTHLRARKLLMPAFHGAALRGYRDMITELTEQEVTRWPAGRVFRSHERMHVLTLEIILRVVFGVAEGPGSTSCGAVLPGSWISAFSTLSAGTTKNCAGTGRGAARRRTGGGSTSSSTPRSPNAGARTISRTVPTCSPAC